MQFWQFCWSTVTECNWADVFVKLYNRNRLMYPKQMEMSRIAFEYFYDGINYPILLPHKHEEYTRKHDDRSYKHVFDGYRDAYLE